jgi:simple sugar transport system permease protein
MPAPLGDFLDASVRTATPLLLAALGETLSERAGVINVGLEGAIIAGCFAAVVTATPLGAPTALAVAALAGLAMAAAFGLVTLVLRADQIITGTAITLLGLGLTGALYRVAFGDRGAALEIPTLAPVAIPGLASIPLLGPALFRQPIPTYIAYAATALAWWWLYRTHAGLALRTTGENPDASRAAGLDARRFQWLGVIVGGIGAGLAGGTLVLAQVGTFAEGMSAGRGFVAIAIVALGRWHPVGAALAALVFGAASALQFTLQSAGFQLPYQLFLALPYVLTLVALALAAGRYQAPAALGRRLAA